MTDSTSHDDQLQVAAPKGAQPATSGPMAATGAATGKGTVDLKGLALAVLARNRASNQAATPAVSGCNSGAPGRGASVAPDACQAGPTAPIEGSAPAHGEGGSGASAPDIDDDWDDDDPRAVAAAIAAAAARRMRELGERPDHYTAISHCRACGPIWLWDGAPADVLGCPWCFNRAKGLPIPRPPI